MFLVELAIVLVAAKVAGDLATRLGQPPVLGQLAAGLILGPVVTAADPFVPGLTAASEPLGLTAQLGVIILMFLAGLETDWEQIRQTGKGAFLSAALGVLLPFLGGWGIAWALGIPQSEAIFVGVILTATSVSITAQTLMELGSLQTREGATILGAAVIDDVIGLIVFSIAIAASSSAHGNLGILGGAIVVFFAAGFALGGRLLPWLVRQAELLHSSEGPLAIALALAFGLAFVAQQVGIAGITGAYLVGLLLNRGDSFGYLTDRVKILAYGFFVPIFLVKTGMDAHIEELGGAAAFVILVSVVAIATKIVGCGLGGRIAGLSTRQSLVVGVGMVGRGEVALIVASLALSAGVIPKSIFAATVVVVTVTTLVTPPLLRLALRGLPRREEVGALVPDAA